MGKFSLVCQNHIPFFLEGRGKFKKNIFSIIIITYLKSLVLKNFLTDNFMKVQVEYNDKISGIGSCGGTIISR